MSENKWVRSISFNKTNPKDIERLRLIGKKSFSRFIKKLLDDEIKRQAVIPSAHTKPATPQQRTKVKPVVTKKEVRPKLNPMLREK
ncbi:hypothetical protein [Alteribacter populi]|uniref:hypothetical protein n=1 Tax=Alteribacter populi TaxID=2011011 RepID=UPI000BBAAD43|nr:hypothetical protein [Alteribacter populi]